MRFLLERLLHGAAVVIVASAVAFFLVHLTGDPARVLLPLDASEADVQQFRHAAGLDRPLYVQYLDFLNRALHGDMGESIRQRQPALGLVMERFGASVLLAGVSLVLSVVVGVPIGIVSAVWRGRAIDHLTMLLALLGQAVPTFWLGIMLILVVGVQLRWLPISGSGTPAHLLMPAFTLSLYTIAIVARLLRANLLEVLRSDYVRTARAKGLHERAVILRHALKNAAIPVVTVFGLQVGFLLGGSVVVEQVFAYPGMGQLALAAIANRDVPVVQAFVVVLAVVVVVANTAVDLLYVWLDPRVRAR